MSIKIHILNHTHWDREWFLTSAYTSQWIPNLIDRLCELKEKNKNYKFLLDGQTLVIRDLLEVAPEYKQKVVDLTASGSLIVGPYYCQPDWRLADGESLIRNLSYGLRDIQQSGGDWSVGWLVDNFGHISQSPQLHRLFGIEYAYVWRGTPESFPYFFWRGFDGSQLFTVNLFAGYRNLYGVTHVPEMAINRLEAEVNSLIPYYPTDDIPLFDGYDLEQNPEDAYLYYQSHSSELPKHFELCQTSAYEFAKEIRNKVGKLPVITGELNSGKFSATLPGTLSARTYLKIMNHDCEHLLYQVCEPLAVLARLKGRAYDASKYEFWGRRLLENEVHDCICGVGIDQVHEKMEINYAKLHEALSQDSKTSLDHILSDFRPGRYAISTNSIKFEGWQAIDDTVYQIQTNGVGVWRMDHREPVEQIDMPVNEFHWENEHYAVDVTQDGVVHAGQAILGRLVLFEERGDTYSDEAGEYWGACKVNGPLVVERRSEHFCQVGFNCLAERKDVHVSARIHLIFDQTEIIRWQIDLDSRGTDFRIDMVFETNHSGKVYAGMPFDIVERPTVDTDLLPRDLEGEFSKILKGQREIGETKIFPFHDFVGMSDGNSSAIIFAKGIRAYQAEKNGKISLPLRRSVEWLTKPQLKNRVGDAGPFMYVPDARCERSVRHEIGVAMGAFGVEDMLVEKLRAAFINPPIIVDKTGAGKLDNWQFLQEDFPLSSLQLVSQRILARFYNPTMKRERLRKNYWKTDMWGEKKDRCSEIGPKEIVTLHVEDASQPSIKMSEGSSISIMHSPVWHVGENQACPERKIIDSLKQKIDRIEEEIAFLEKEIKRGDGKTANKRQHEFYIRKRELYELQLSVMLNEKKLSLSKSLYQEMLFMPDPDLAELGLVLNQYRIMRRIYDYVSVL